MAGCCGEELLLLWCSLEAGVDGLPSLLLWCSLELGRSRERKTAADRESKEKREHWCWGRGRGFRCG